MRWAIAQTSQTTLADALAADAEQLITWANRDTTQRDTETFVGNLDPESLDPEGLIAYMPSFAEVCTPAGKKQRLQRFVSNGDALPISDTGFSVVLRGQPWIETNLLVKSVGEHLVYNQPIMRNNHLVAVAQVARPIVSQNQQALLSQLYSSLLIGGGAVTLLVFGLTWVVAAHNMNPLRRMAQAQQNFVADLSHELRTPLTTVRGNLSLLRRDLKIEDRQAVLDDAMGEVERMTRLVNQLLLITRAGVHAHADSAHELPCQPMLLAPILHEMHRQAAALAPGRELLLQMPTDVAACGNADALKQVLLILLDNAAKFTPLGGRITLTVMHDTLRRCACITVQDTGIGIASADLPHVFERGYRGGATHAGTGLGLFIAKQLMQVMGGDITVTSQRGTGVGVGSGSTFTLILPQP
jgi:signal transduction histidine kinase